MGLLFLGLSRFVPPILSRRLWVGVTCLHACLLAFAIPLGVGAAFIPDMQAQSKTPPMN